MRKKYHKNRHKFMGKFLLRFWKNTEFFRRKKYHKSRYNFQESFVKTLLEQMRFSQETIPWRTDIFVWIALSDAYIFMYKSFKVNSFNYCYSIVHTVDLIAPSLYIVWYPAGKIAEKAMWRSVFLTIWHRILHSDSTKTPSSVTF